MSTEGKIDRQKQTDRQMGSYLGGRGRQTDIQTNGHHSKNP